jgi:hypothetical protein
MEALKYVVGTLLFVLVAGQFAVWLVDEQPPIRADTPPAPPTVVCSCSPIVFIAPAQEPGDVEQIDDEPDPFPQLPLDVWCKEPPPR